MVVLFIRFFLLKDFNIIKEYMNNRYIAIQEICEGFTMECKADAALKKLINSEFKKDLHNRDKICMNKNLTKL